MTAYIDIRGPNRELQLPIRSSNSSNRFDSCNSFDSYNSCFKAPRRKREGGPKAPPAGPEGPTSAAIVKLSLSVCLFDIPPQFPSDICGKGFK